jgi:hypothetical protein
MSRLAIFAKAIFADLCGAINTDASNRYYGLAVQVAHKDIVPPEHFDSRGAHRRGLVQ